MLTVKVSPKYQVVIPEKIRNEMKLLPGVRLAVIEKDNVIHLIPVGPLKKARGMARGVTTRGLREEYDRVG